MNEKPEKLNHRKTATEKKLIAAKHREKQLKHKRKRLTRSERSRRFCACAGMIAFCGVQWPLVRWPAATKRR